MDGLKWGMLMYPDHLQKEFDFGQCWPNFGPSGGQKTEENTKKE